MTNSTEEVSTPEAMEMAPVTRAISRASNLEDEVVVQKRNFLKRYMFEGQFLEGEKLGDDLQKKNLLYRYLVWKRPRVIGVAIPFVLFYLVYWSGMYKHGLWHLYETRWPMTLTMVFGAFFAGATSEGGGAVAFPVMTLVIGTTPVVARDFSLMIQSAGMTAAAFLIFYQRIMLEWHTILWGSMGATVGICLGLSAVAPYLPPPISKMVFVSVWLSFAFSLMFLNCMGRRRRVFLSIPDFTWWQPIALASFGFIGGILSSISGSGVDICCFSCLTLLFRVSEKVATPTSVVLMAINTVVGFFFKHFYLGGMEDDSWDYLMVCVPVVVLFAPVGAWLSSYTHRIVMALLIYVLDIVQFVAACAIVIPKSPYPVALALGSAGVVFSGFVFFSILTILGAVVLKSAVRKEKKNADDVYSVLDSLSHVQLADFLWSKETAPEIGNAVLEKQISGAEFKKLLTNFEDSNPSEEMLGVEVPDWKLAELRLDVAAYHKEKKEGFTPSELSTANPDKPTIARIPASRNDSVEV